MNGCGKMIDDYPSQGPWVSDTWVIFGDPSVIIFTDNPTAMNISHPVAIGQGATQFDVTCDMEGALISLTVDGEIIGTAYSNGGSTDITINPPLSTSLPTMQVTVTAKNRIPYMEDVTIGSLNEPYYTITYDNITDDDDASGTLDPGENANINVTVKNMGIDATAPATITASCADITINNSSQNLGTLLSNSTENVSFNADIPSSIPGGTVITVTFNLTDGTYSATELVKEFIVGIDMTGYFTLDFEGLVDYSTDFTPWRSYEGDGQSSWQSSDCDFPGEGGAFGFMAFNPSDAGFGLASAHSGVRVGLAICPSDDVTAADDWTMSPKVPLGTNSSVSFWVLSPKPGTWGNNSYNVLVSTTDDDPSSFTAIASDEEAPDTWTERTYDLSAYDNQDIHIGIQDVSISRFMLWIDDISINTSTVNTEELSAKDQISVFPNPASGHVNINLGDVEINDIKVSVFDMAGKLLKTDYVFIDGNRICMDMSSFTNGIYYINVKTIKQSYTKKITILK